MKSFWENLPRPFFCLAPLADVTDAAFRRVIAKYGKPNLMWTEFVSVDGLCYALRSLACPPEFLRRRGEGGFAAMKHPLLRDFMYTAAERPIVAQIFGSKPENFYKVAELIQKLGFDGIDINMGCPDRNVEKQGGGAAMIKSPELAQEVVRATQEGGGGLPVSVKTRVGFNKVELETWIPKLLETKLAAITVHARTRKEMSKTPARWGHVKEVVAMAKGSGTLIIGNGDVKNITDAKAKAAETGADGIMLGRAIFGNPWLFANARLPVPLEERLLVMVEHTKLFHELLGDIKNFAVMKKHYKAYVNGFDGAKELRMKLMETETPEEVEAIVQNFLATPCQTLGVGQGLAQKVDKDKMIDSYGGGG